MNEILSALGSQIERLYIYVVCLSVNSMLMDTTATFVGCPFGRCVKLSEKGGSERKSLISVGGVEFRVVCTNVDQGKTPTNTEMQMQETVSSPNQEGNCNCSETKSVRTTEAGGGRKARGGTDHSLNEPLPYERLIGPCPAKNCSTSQRLYGWTLFFLQKCARKN